MLRSLPIIEVATLCAPCSACRGLGRCAACGGASMVGSGEAARMCPDCLGGRCRACMGRGWSRGA